MRRVSHLIIFSFLVLLTCCKPALKPTSPATPAATATPNVFRTITHREKIAASGRSVGDRPFWILPIFDYITDHPQDRQTLQTEMNNLKEQIGSNTERFKIGFSFIYGGDRANLATLCELAKQNNLSLGIIIGGATHHVGETSKLGKILQTDLRLYQWRLDGHSWKGVFKENEGTLETQESPRDWKIPTPSRYAHAVQEDYTQNVTRVAQAAAEVIRNHPGVIGIVNYCIEEELATGGGKSDAYLADYSPYAITEFRDWLCHRGEYGPGAKFGGEGAAVAITGETIQVNGHATSPFYDDPTPSDSNGTGQSFNEHFRTDFLTWSLAYWDLEKFPEPITDENFIMSPQEGKGAIARGFDAPRTRNGSAFWKAWSWDYHDRADRYPPGNPEHPAFGFRQTMIRHWVSDMGLKIRDAGVPSDLIFPHQIPGEFWNKERDLSSASTIWSGYLEFNKNLGITFFGPAQVSRLRQYSHAWGIFEWHPAPNAPADSDRLYKAAFDSLENYYNGDACALFPGWWSKNGVVTKTFPLNNSRFATAIKDWLKSKE